MDTKAKKTNVRNISTGTEKTVDIANDPSRTCKPKAANPLMPTAPPSLDMNLKAHRAVG